MNIETDSFDIINLKIFPLLKTLKLKFDSTNYLCNQDPIRNMFNSLHYLENSLINLNLDL